jgi:hypothetical protein
MENTVTGTGRWRTALAGQRNAPGLDLRIGIGNCHLRVSAASLDGWIRPLESWEATPETIENGSASRDCSVGLPRWRASRLDRGKT